MKIKFVSVLLFALIALIAMFASAVFAGGGVSLPPDLGFDWPQWVISLGGYLDTITTVIGTFAVLAALTPTPKDDGALRILRSLVDFLGANFYNARNERQ